MCIARRRPSFSSFFDETKDCLITDFIFINFTHFFLLERDKYYLIINKIN